MARRATSSPGRPSGSSLAMPSSPTTGPFAERIDRRVWVVMLLVAALLAAWAAWAFNPANERADDIPERMREAYQNAEQQATEFDHECRGLQWEVLAGIGRVETKHANGGEVDDDGVADPSIFGPRLDGTGAGGNTTGHGDTDGGKLDDDAEYDRAMGPMQFIPTTWEVHGKDGDGDGEKNPQDVDDAALAAASLLCANEDIDLSDQDTLESAIKRYNNSDTYVADVLTWADRYGR